MFFHCNFQFCKESRIQFEKLCQQPFLYEHHQKGILRGYWPQIQQIAHTTLLSLKNQATCECESITFMTLCPGCLSSLLIFLAFFITLKPNFCMYLAQRGFWHCSTVSSYIYLAIFISTKEIHHSWVREAIGIYKLVSHKFANVKSCLAKENKYWVQIQWEPYSIKDALCLQRYERIISHRA